MGQPVERLIPICELAAGSRVLDLGCGSGSVSYAQFPQLEFVGMDQYAHVNSQAWPPNAHLVLGDAERLPYRDDSFDCALCGFVFEHFSDPHTALRDLARVIRPGGLLYLSAPRFDSLHDRLYRYTFKGGGHVQRYTFQSLLAMVYEETGFKLEAMGPSPGGYTWLKEVPWCETIRSLLYNGFRWWRRATGTNLLESSDYLLLFRLGGQPGLAVIEQVCSNCGSPTGDSFAPSARTWRCPTCAADNILV